MRHYSRLSFQKKLLIFTLSMILFIGGTMGILIRFIIFPSLVNEMQNRGTSAARRLAESTRTFILTRDTVSLTASLFDEKSLDRNIAYITVSDNENRPLAHTIVGVRSDTYSVQQLVPVAGVSLKPGSIALESRGSISDVVVPVYEGIHQIGVIRVGLDQRFINRVIDRLSYFHLGFTSLICALGLLFGMYLSGVITRPVTSLTQLVGQISRGNLNTHISIAARKPCREILKCGEATCPAYEDNTLSCWFVDNTLCGGNSMGRFPKKLIECRSCAVYKSHVGDEIVQLADAFNHMTRRLLASELKLRCSEEKYRLLFNSDPNPVFVVATDTNCIVDANDRAAEVYRWPKVRLIGMKFTDLGFCDDYSRIEGALANMEAGERPYSLLSRVRCRRPDGQTCWVNIYFCHCKYLGERSVIVTTTDINEIIEAEAMLIQAGKMTTLGEMATGVAHELSQPLNAIKLGSDFLRVMMEQHKAVAEEDLRDVAEEISKQVSRASSIINHLREFGRKTEISRHRVDVNRAVQGVFTILGQQLKVHGIDVVADLDESLPPILADQNRIEQVLINLINNARDAMDAKRKVDTATRSGILTIRTFTKEDRVMVIVGDTGAGIAEAIHGRIFEPFFTTKEVGKGTGLGLSISYGIVRDYNGTIDFETEENVGTTFRLSFPRAPEED